MTNTIYYKPEAKKMPPQPLKVKGDTLQECNIEDCNGVSAKVGLCTRHYQQIRQYGETRQTSRDRRPAIIEGGIAKIPVGLKARDGYAIVDAKYAYLDKYKWHIHKGYAATLPINRKRKMLHHIILPIKDGLVTDHINRNRLDNREANLRLVERIHNSWNVSLSKNNTSGYIGVYYKGYGQWGAFIGYKRQKIHLGSHDTPELAAQAYNEASIRLRGAYATLNEIPEGKPSI